MGIPKKKAACHPERQHHCKGLCQECYKEAYYEANKERFKALAKENYQQNKERVKKINKAWAQANKDKVQATNKRWAEKHPEQAERAQRDWQLRKSFWTLAQYTEVYMQQKGLCAICLQPSKKRLSADHDHETNAPRELLCNHCNLLLGKMKDDPKLLESAAAYLRKWGKT